MTSSAASALDPQEILARILSSDPTFDFEPPLDLATESGFIDDDLYDTTHLVDESPEDNNAHEYIGVGAKRKTFRIPIENFTEFHTTQGFGFHHIPEPEKQNKINLKKEKYRCFKSDSVEKLDEDKFLCEPKIDNKSSLLKTESKLKPTESSFRSSNQTSRIQTDINNVEKRYSSSSMGSSSSGSTGSPLKSNRNSVHYASTNIVSIPSPAKALEVHRTTKQDTSQALGSLRKRVQIVQDESSLKLLPYTIPRDCATRVAFPAATWDLMMQNFRIALSMDNVFICDHFLGHDVAGHLLRELQMLKTSGHFERHMQRSNNPRCTNYACVFLTEPDDSLPRLDGLVLMVYKLARYFSSDWKQTSVQITYYPEGHAMDSILKQGNHRKLLKCVYFANPNPVSDNRRLSSGSGSSSEENQLNTGRYFINTNGQETVVEPKFDRLLAFWGDSINHKIEACSSEKFVINVWMAR